MEMERESNKLLEDPTQKIITGLKGPCEERTGEGA